jgi:hypothetical protein
VKTVVFQSFRTTGVPGWMEACMRSAREWAAGRGFDYRFFDDSFLALAPAWFRERCGGELCPVTDLARLVAARQLLAAGYERTVWLDADVLVFAPEALGVDTAGFAFCLEVWPVLEADGRLDCVQQANNAISVFTRGNPQLDFLIDACLRIAAGKPRIDKVEVGTHLVSKLAGLVPMPLVTNVGIFSPVIVNDVASGTDRFVPAYAARLPSPLAAVNLCQSLVGQAVHGQVAGAAAYEKAVARLIESRGAVVNRHVRAAAR